MRLSILLFFLTSGISQAQSFNQNVLNIINEFRIKNGKTPLAYDSSYQKDADRWTKKMAKVGLVHDKRCQGCYENAFWGAGDEKQVVELWIKSMRHRINLLGSGTSGVVSIYKIGDTRFHYVVFRRYK